MGNLLSLRNFSLSPEESLRTRHPISGTTDPPNTTSMFHTRWKRDAIETKLALREGGDAIATYEDPRQAAGGAECAEDGVRRDIGVSMWTSHGATWNARVCTRDLQAVYEPGNVDVVA